MLKIDRQHLENKLMITILTRRVFRDNLEQLSQYYLYKSRWKTNT